MTKHAGGMFRMPWGKHRGLRLVAIAQLPDGVGYLEWLASRASGTAQEMAAAYLEREAMPAHIRDWARSSGS